MNEASMESFAFHMNMLSGPGVSFNIEDHRWTPCSNGSGAEGAQFWREQLDNTGAIQQRLQPDLVRLVILDCILFFSSIQIFEMKQFTYCNR